MRSHWCWLAVTLAIAATDVVAQDTFNRFRGPDADGIAADDRRLPERWDENTNLAWEVKIPGFGWSSPVIVNDRVFVTSVHSDNEYERPKGGLYLGQGVRNPPDSVHHWMVYCLDLASGKKRWAKELHTGKPAVPRHPKSTYAVETPTTDGERLYVLFGDVGLSCLSFDGEVVWSNPIEPKKTLADYGAAASPVVHNGQVIMIYDNQEESWLASFDAKTGDEQWRVSREERTTWATPYLWKTKDRVEIVTCGKNKNRSYGLDGKVLWEFSGKMSNLVIPSPFAANGLLYITSGYVGDRDRPVYAIKPGASGDISLAEGETSNEFIQWHLPQAGPYNPTPIVYAGQYITLHDRGFLTAHEAATGAEIYGKRRFPSRASFTASPWAYNGKVYFLSEQGDTWMLEPGPEFKPERINSLKELSIATPAIAQGRLFVRTASRVLCLTAASPAE